MSTRRSFPLSISRIIVTLGLAGCILVAILLAVLAAMVAAGWPRAAADMVLHGMKAGRDIAPWVSVMLAGISAILVATAFILRNVRVLLNSIAQGEPFLESNAARLRGIGWIMLALQGIGLAMALAMAMMPPPLADMGISFRLSFNGVLAALLAFVLAEVFEKARIMRDELEGTI